MRFKVYNEGKILAPLKCGTRYLDETFGGDCGEMSTMDLIRNLFLKNTEAIIIREPYKHLESAVHTEVMGYCNKDREITPQEIEKILWDYHSNNSNLENATHWSAECYQYIYYFWRRNRKNIEIVHLNDLSKYLISKKIKKLPNYDPDNYNFNHYKNWCTKEDLMLYIKINHLPIWNNYMKQIEDSMVFYNYLMDKNHEIKLL